MDWFEERSRHKAELQQERLRLVQNELALASMFLDVARTTRQSETRERNIKNARAACEAVGRRCPAPPLGLITMAALLPPEWTVRLIDCNAEALTDDDLAWADLAMTGGMLVQQRETLAIIRRCRSRGLPVAVGGPDATSSPHLYCEAD